jgi:hypothetical protein
MQKLINVNSSKPGTPEGMRLLGKPRCIWKDNIITCLKEIGGGCFA